MQKGVIKKVSVIGGSGFIGSRLCKLLYDNHVPFEILDICASQSFPGHVKLADIRNYSQLKECLEGDVVVNLAATHRDDIAELTEYIYTNVEGARILTNVCMEKGIDKIIFTSSVAVYGFTLIETGEDGRINPFNEYGKTKAIAEEVYEGWRDQHPENRTLIIVRPTVVFGEGNRGNVYNLMNQIASGRFVMIGSGENRKSMAYVENIAAFLFQSIHSEIKYGVYNYIDKPDLSMNQLVAFLREKLKCKHGTGLRIPYGVGLFLGYSADFVARLFGVKMPISSIRVKKFCASTEFSSRKADLDGFEAPYTLLQGLERTLDADFTS